jgi:exopolyphosphatase/guanosine-5'-triphosphate,3'-diphosphate pyrophosphatase
VNRLREEAGIDVHVVSGREEARLIYLGVSSGMNIGDREALFIDIGGGSTEVIVGDQHQYRYLDTLKLGSIRLASRFFKPDFRGAVQRGKYKEIQRYVRNTAIHTLQTLGGYHPDIVVGSSGTIMNLAAIAARKGNWRGSRRADVLRREDLDEVVEWLCSLSLADRRKVPGLNPERGDIIIPGAAIVQTFMDELDLEEIVVSDRGLREGLPLDHLARGEHARLLQTMTFRERSVLQLGHVCGFDEPHARNVARLALGLFDTAKEAGLHDLGNWSRDLLEYAALLHDIGVFLSFGDHEVHSAYFIRHAELLGFDDREIEIIASTAMFHRRNTPRKKHPALASLDPDGQQIVRVLAVFLRLAESLDRTHMGIVRGASLHAKGRGAAVLDIRCRRDCQLELWGLQNHRKIFRRVFNRELEVEQGGAGRSADAAAKAAK